jgi:Flp pilus assembly protein TadD
MKIINKVAAAALALVSIGTTVSAQSLDDAKAAISAEQYQKAKSMLQNLTVTQSTKDENYFYLGWVYLKEDEPDSAKLWFNKGLAVNPKSALNLVGLGAVARLDKDQATASSDFNQALSISKKDSKPYVYIGKSYLLTTSNATTAPPVIAPADANAAIAVLEKDSLLNPKDPELFLTLGAAQLSQLRSTDAYGSFSTAQSLDPKSPAADVALGVISKYADNFDDAVTNFKAAIAIDPNFGPAYREWAETDVRWANTDPKVAADKAAEAATLYKKYITLTDYSIQSQMRYADFLIYSRDYTTLQQVATQLSKAANSNLRVYRYLGYAAYENKDYANGLAAMNTWMTKAGSNRILPQDYLYLGRLEVASGQDSVGVLNLKKAYDLDSTQADVFEEIAKSDASHKKYKEAADNYKMFIQKSHNVTLNSYYQEGLNYYKAFAGQYYSTATPKPVPDTALLIQADTALSYVQHKATAAVAPIALYRARVNDFREPDRNTSKGLAKPYYEQYIAIVTAKQPIRDGDKQFLAEAYDYLGRYYELVAKDDAKASENYTQALVYEPTDTQALDYNTRHKK